MFEHRTAPLLPLRLFFIRIFQRGVLAAFILVAALAVGMIGYHSLENLSWLDSFLNAAMILSGMGPVTPLTNPDAKIFAACYAIFSGIAFVSLIGVAFSPVVHRWLHAFHLEHAPKKSN